MNLLKLSSREKVIACVASGLVMLLVMYHGIWNPVVNKLSSLDEEIFAMQLKVRRAMTLLRQKEEIQEEAKKYPNLERMDARKDEEEIASLLNFIELEARKTRVSLSDVKPEQVSSDRISKRYIVELAAESGLKELIEFIYKLQYSPEMLRIERVEAAPKSEKSDILRSSLTVTRVVVK